MAVSDAQGNVALLRGQVADGYAKIESFGELTVRYAHYTYSGMTQAELSLTDRADVLDLLDRMVLPKIHVSGLRLSNNQLTLTVTAGDLQSINLVVQQLETDPLVNFCTVTTAATETIIYRDTNPDEYVSASVTVYLNEPSAVTWDEVERNENSQP